VSVLTFDVISSLIRTIIALFDNSLHNIPAPQIRWYASQK